MTRSRIALGLTLAVALATLSTVALGWWWNDDDDAAATADAREIDWMDLVPEGFEPFDPFAELDQATIDTLFDGSAESNAKLAELEERSSYAPTVPELDGEQVKLPGYLVPLDYDGATSFDEFLIVPYVGACIHTPPPPANQVVHANAEKTVEMDNPWDPVWVFGTIATETVRSDLAESGYRMRVDRVEPWSE